MFCSTCHVLDKFSFFTSLLPAFGLATHLIKFLYESSNPTQSEALLFIFDMGHLARKRASSLKMPDLTRVPRFSYTTPQFRHGHAVASSARLPMGEPSDLSTQFSRFVNNLDSSTCYNPRSTPSPFMPPTAVIQAILNSLQRNDYPEKDAGGSNCCCCRCCSCSC